MITKNERPDVIVIGGGPSGMMAALTAAKRGKKVLLLEKNDFLGRKLLITGGGRCNLTNEEYDTRKLLLKFKDDSKFLFSAFSHWDVKSTLDFFHSRGMETKTEALGRVFPVSNSAKSVWEVLTKELHKQKVKIQKNSEVTGFVLEDKKIIGVKTKHGGVLESSAIVLATGGKSHPETGSTGEGFMWLKEIGHSVTEPEASLVPLTTDTPWVKKLQGISFSDIGLSVFEGESLVKKVKGKVLFTHFGLSGPTILNLSKEIRDGLRYNSVKVVLDIFPTLDHGTLDRKIQSVLTENQNKKIKNSLLPLVPTAFAHTLLSLLNIDEDTPCNSLKKEDRLALGKLLKKLEVNITGLLGTDKAIITSGGVNLKEVDFKTMKSRLYPNLFLVGDVLDIDRPSGGYSLQLCWTTGAVAGENA